MTLPPPPDSFGSQPPSGGGVPPWGGPGDQPAYSGGPQQGQPYGQPQGQLGGQPQGQLGGQPQWGPQQQWAGGPPPPPNRGGKGKWILVGLALVAVIAVSVVATVLVLRPDSGGKGSGPTSANADSEFASANDTGPANIITEDPTCDAWGRIARDYAAEAEAVKWNDRDPQVPATDWTPEQRAMYESVGTALTQAADQTANLVTQTPHRVMRELYRQFIAYTEAFVDNIPSYDSKGRGIANVTTATLSGLSAICSAIEYKSAQTLAPLVSLPSVPSQLSPISGKAQMFITEGQQQCQEWITSTDKYDAEIASWVAIDANTPATAWTPEQESVYGAVAPVMANRADEMERIGRDSGNATFEDFAVAAAQYLRAYVVAIPKYTSRDNFLTDVVRYVTGAILWACKATA